jgi:hypothetical protein
MSSGHGHEPAAVVTDAATDTDRDTAIVVTTAEAARLASVSPRTIRRWIAQGWLPAIDSEQGHLVSPADLPVAAERARRGRGHGHGHGHEERGHEAGHGHEAAVTDAATAMTANGRAQLDAIMHEWLAPLIDRIATLERENGRLEAEQDELRRRAEAAEASEALHEPVVAELRHRVAEKDQALAEVQHRADQAEQEAATLRAQLAPPVVAQDATTGAGSTTGASASPAPAEGLWARLGRWWRGEGGSQ